MPAATDRPRDPNMDDQQLRTAWQNRQPIDSTTHLSGPLGLLMKHTLSKRVKQLGALAQAWDEVIPDPLREHTALESFARGVLTVIVDSAPHRFQLEMLLRQGLHKALVERFAGPLNRIRLVPGQFFSVDLEGFARYSF